MLENIYSLKIIKILTVIAKAVDEQSADNLEHKNEKKKQINFCNSVTSVEV